MRIMMLLVAGMMVAQPAAAQQSFTSNDRNWKHEASGVKLPREVAGLGRGDIFVYDEAQSNIGVTYGSNGSGDYYATVYLYPLVDGDIALWFDRAYSVIALNEAKYDIAEAGAPVAFAPRDGREKSGLMASFGLAGDGFASTLVALFPAGNGLTGKLRLSSTDSDRAALEAFARRFISDINWRAENASAVTPVVDCPDTLSFAENPAVLPIKEDAGMETLILSQLFGAVVKQKKAERAEANEPTPAPTPWCREPGTASMQTTVYRPAGRTNAYLLAQNDAGLSVHVWRNIFGAEEDGERYMIELAQAPNIYRFPEMDGLPSPRRLVKHIAESEAYWGAPAEDVRQARVQIVE